MFSVFSIGSIRIGRIFDIDLEINYTWFVIFVLVTFGLAFSFFPSQYPDLTVIESLFAGIFASFFFFSSLIFHELCHSLVAKYYKIPIKKITLFIFGGVAQMGDEPQSPGIEFLMAAAGPLSSIFLAILFFSLWFVLSVFRFPAMFIVPFSALIYINLSLAFFNLVPGYPLDGGRILRSILWFFMGDIVRSTRIASIFGQGYSVLLITGGLFLTYYYRDAEGLWLVFIGLFLNYVAKASYRQVFLKATLDKYSVSDLVSSNIAVVESSISIGEFVNTYSNVSNKDDYFFPVVQDGKLIGKVSMADTSRVNENNWPFTALSEVTNQLNPQEKISYDIHLMVAFQMMTEHGLNHLFVVRNGIFLGIITNSDILNILSSRK